MGLTMNSSERAGEILVITGERGVGKTTFCQKVIDQFYSQRKKVQGLITPGRFVNAQKTGIFVKNLNTGTVSLLASSLAGEIEGIQMGYWVFDPAVLECENNLLKQVNHPDLLVIDELGPLEFNRQLGWMSAFEILQSKQFGKALVVIRSECLDSFSRMGFVFHLWQPSDFLSPDSHLNI